MHFRVVLNTHKVVQTSPASNKNDWLLKLIIRFDVWVSVDTESVQIKRNLWFEAKADTQKVFYKFFDMFRLVWHNIVWLWHVNKPAISNTVIENDNMMFSIETELFSIKSNYIIVLVL